MNLITIVGIAVLLCQPLVRCYHCDWNLLKVAFPDPDYVIYGLREDKSILLLPSNIARNESIAKEFSKLLDADTHSIPGSNIKHYGAMLIEVHGLLQFLTVWQEIAFSPGKLYTLTRLSYFNAFRLVFAPTWTKIVHKAKFITLMYFSDLATYHFNFKTVGDSEILLRQTGEGRIGSYQITFGRIGTKLFIDKVRKVTGYWIEPYEYQDLMALNHGIIRWFARHLKSVIVALDCIAETKSKYGVGILYYRKNLVSAYYEMGDSAFDCKEQKCREELSDDGGKMYHDKEVSAVHQKGSIYLGFRNGYLFSYRVMSEKEKFSEILFALDLAHRAETEEFGKDDEFYLFSIDGREAIAVICGPKTYYRIYNVNPRNGMKVVYLKKSNMTVVNKLEKKCRKVDYDAKEGKLIFFIDSSTAHELKLTINHDGILKSYPDPKLNKFDNYRGDKKPFEGIESQWPLHLRNGRTLFYNEKTNAIEMTYNIISAEKSIPVTKILTNYGNHVKALLYFPNEYIEDTYMEMFRNRSSKHPMSFYGIANCTVFVVMKYEDIDKINLKGNGCDKSYQMRAFLSDSYITVLRTKDGINVQGARMKVSIDYNDVVNGILSDKLVFYTHNLVDSDFEKDNTFTIVPHTFHTIHNIDGYTYYQYKPREKCWYYFQRRKITKSAEKSIKNVAFHAFSIAHRQIMSEPCNFVMSFAMYDESIPGVLYLMKSGSKTVVATPNAIVHGTLMHVWEEKFLANFIYSTSFPYVLYNDSKGVSVISVENPSDIKITFNATFDTIGIYTGKILYREAEITRILQMETEAVEERGNDTVAVTKAIAKQDFEKALREIESEIIGRPEFLRQKCRLLNAPFFMAFILKVSVLDMVILLILIILVVYHRSHIIPARRRYKIKMGILRHRKKRRLRDRARRRLRKLNLLRRRQRMNQQEMEAKRQAQLIAATVGQLGLRQQEIAGSAERRKKSSSTSSSDLVTAGGGRITVNSLPRTST